MNLDVYNTHMELYPYTKFDYPVIEKWYTATDKFTGEEKPCGYIIEDGKLFLPRGTSISRLEHMCDVKANYIMESDPYEEMDYQHSALYDPKDKLQEDSIKFLLESTTQSGLNLKMGRGKAVPLTTKIPTPNGYKLMKDIKIGDKVFGSNGKVYNVTGVYPQGKKDVYEITFSDGRKAKCCKEHLWQISHPWNPSRKIVLPLYEIMKDYKIYREAMLRYSNHRIPFQYKYRVQLLSNPVHYDHQDVPIDPYVLGALIGNGCLSDKPLTISSGDEFVPNKIAKRYGWNVKKNSDKNYNYVFHDYDGGFKERVNTQNFLADLPELIGKLSYEKYIPDIYMYNDYEIRMELLRGLMDTDGSISYSEGRFNISYSSTSKRLLEQIQELIRGLGYIANISNPDKRVDKYTNGYCANISIRVPQKFKQELFSHPRKLKIAKEAAKRNDFRQPFTHLTIKEINKVGYEECQCITVNSDDHLFLTENFIVTHNTFVTAYASTKLRERTLIITPNDSLKIQWINTYLKMFDYRSKHLMNISGSNVMNDILEGLIQPKDVYFVNHQTLQSFMTSTNGFTFHNFFKRLNIGIKVYDESHLQFNNILMIDFYSNTKRTWYLTATFDRSDKTESACFKKAFTSVVTYGEIESKEDEVKHVLYHVVNFNSHISPKDRASVIGYQGLTGASYGKYAFMNDTNETAYRIILMILNMMKNVEGRTLIFVPLIDAVDKVVKKLKIDFSEKSVAAYHSKIPKDEKESAKKKDIIVSTIKSCGTGQDIPGLRVVICLDPIASKVTAEQVIGRIRPYKVDDEIKDTYFFDCVDVCIPPLNYWFRARYKKIQTLVKESINLNLEK